MLFRFENSRPSLSILLKQIKVKITKIFIPTDLRSEGETLARQNGKQAEIIRKLRLNFDIKYKHSVLQFKDLISDIFYFNSNLATSEILI